MHKYSPKSVLNKERRKNVEIGGLIDSEYDVLKDMTKEEVITYLLDFGFPQEDIDYYFECCSTPWEEKK